MNKAHVDIEHSSKKVDANTSPYPYVISNTKLIVLSVTTFGLFDVYWFYKQFKSFKAEKDWKINPWLRAFFAGIMAYSLFYKISVITKDFDENWKMKPLGLGITYFLLSILWKLPDPYWLLSYLSFLPLIQVQYNINLYWKKKYGDKVIKSKFGTANYIWSSIGGIFLILAIWATFYL